MGGESVCTDDLFIITRSHQT
uniref:Uncharacterized protein n=1 Tax=Anguilla anguilla TaxID=7936 RepID=A0A0E9Q6E9_ANGAN